MSSRAAAAAKKAPAGKKAAAKRAAPLKAPTQAVVGFEKFVFVNCPFDDDYLPLLHAMLFAIHDCGFVARFAVEDAGAAEQRITKICRLINESRLSIHDISRIELTRQHFPRFNMPFEAGIAYGAIQFDPDSGRDMLVLEAVPFRGQITLSDLAGIDPKTHNNNPDDMVAAVRGFLRAKKPPGSQTRGAAAIVARYRQFVEELPILAEAVDFTPAEITSFDYLTDWGQAMAQWIVKR